MNEVSFRPGGRRGAVAVRAGAPAGARVLTTGLVTGLVTALVTALLAGLLLAATAAPAAACSCVRADVQEAADRVDVVLSGTVVDVQRESVQRGRPKRDELTLSLRVDRVYQGTITKDTVAVTANASTAACGLGVVPEDERYMVFAFARGSELSTNICTGTRKAGQGYTEKVEEVLGAGTAPKGDSSPTSAPPERTALDVEDPPEFGRAAAPGGALAIVGLLGLLLVRRRARRD